jgi:hypothetical protein
LFYKYSLIALLVLGITTLALAEESCEGSSFQADQVGDSFGFCWDKNPEEFLGGYRLYRKRPNHTTWEFYKSFDTSICGESICETGPMIVGSDLGAWDWAVRAFDSQSFESDNSNIVGQLVQETPTYPDNIGFNN